jgi:ABC-type uncharacterized transport system involved in gliding motility auxiliary subunit
MWKHSRLLVRDPLPLALKFLDMLRSRLLVSHELLNLMVELLFAYVVFGNLILFGLDRHVEIFQFLSKSSQELGFVLELGFDRRVLSLRV